MVAVGELAGTTVAFIPRHGPGHTLPPHKVPYKANLAALKELGVRHVISTCVVGSLNKGIEPGLFVVPDQFINLTWGRDDTFEQDGGFLHLPMAEPYCVSTRTVVREALAALALPYRPTATVVVIQGPRFSTLAESRLYAQWGGDVVNMTQYPECYFAHELGLCYAAVATVTDYDVGVGSAISMEREGLPQVLAIFQRNTASTLLLLEELARRATRMIQCDCAASRIAAYYEGSDS